MGSVANPQGHSVGLQRAPTNQQTSDGAAARALSHHQLKPMALKVPSVLRHSRIMSEGCGLW
jgi:hypothetical protein